MTYEVDLVVPIKSPYVGKSRLRGALGIRDEHTHAALVLAIALDTLSAVRAANGVRRVLVVSPNPETLTDLAELDIEIVSEKGSKNGAGGLNSALRHGETLLRSRDPQTIVGALQADLPALKSADLTAAIFEADQRRAFTSDWEGTGTSFLLSTPGGPLDPRFGPGSAQAHRDSGAFALALDAPSLRSDVDTPADLMRAKALDLGRHTSAVLAGLLARA